MLHSTGRRSGRGVLSEQIITQDDKAQKFCHTNQAASWIGTDGHAYGGRLVHFTRTAYCRWSMIMIGRNRECMQCCVESAVLYVAAASLCNRLRTLLLRCQKTRCEMECLCKLHKNLLAHHGCPINLISSVNIFALRPTMSAASEPTVSAALTMYACTSGPMQRLGVSVQTLICLKT